MKLQYSFSTALSGVLLHKKRSLLTILGIVIGITSIMLIMGIGQSANKLIIGEIQAMGSNVVMVAPGKDPTGLNDFASLFQDSIKKKDIEALENKNNVPGLKDLSPHVFYPGSVTYGNESFQALVLGTSDVVAHILDIVPRRGVFFNDDSIRLKEKVAVIGVDVEDELFGSSGALNKKVKIKGQNFRVIGVLPNSGASVFANMDNTVFVPYTTAQHYLTGTNYFSEVIIRTEPGADVERVARDITATLREQHDITDPEKDDFQVNTQADIIDRVGLVTDILTIVLTAVAAISLLVGGIGIMNMMLVTVTERTKEVGLRKALGATNRDILIQFLWESIILTGMGGVIGITLGLSLSYVVSIILTQVAGVNWDFAVPMSAIMLGIGSSVLVGVVFGLYPASQASRRSPIEALRYE